LGKHRHMDLESVKKHYQNLDRGKIESLATTEAKSLRPEVIPVLIGEIQRRNMPDSVILALQRQLKEPTPDKLAEYCTLLQSQPCPKCGTRSAKLNANMTSEVFSIVFITRSTKKLGIACPDCLDSFKKNANAKSGMLGWWAFPWGPIKTIQSFLFNAKMNKENHLGIPNRIFQGFVYQNIGAIEAAKNSPDKLQHIITVQ